MIFIYPKIPLLFVPNTIKRLNTMLRTCYFNTQILLLRESIWFSFQIYGSALKLGRYSKTLFFKRGIFCPIFLYKNKVLSIIVVSFFFIFFCLVWRWSIVMWFSIFLRNKCRLVWCLIQYVLFCFFSPLTTIYFCIKINKIS